jgi:tetratricopeptide (TPR) repeat protein
MKKFVLYISLLFSLVAFAQSEQLAENYFDKGEFEKALISYQELLKIQPNNWNYFQKSVACYQQLQQLDLAEKALENRYEKYKQSTLLVDLGANYLLKKEASKATKYFQQALEKIKKTPTEVYGIAAAFERMALIDYALQAYEIALSMDKNANYNFQMAPLYGQKGDLEKMISLFLTESFINPQNLVAIQNYLARFMAEDGGDTFKTALRKALILETQKSQAVFWNEFLSWFYIQQKEYGKAFIQQKALYKRNPELFLNIVNLAKLTIEENDSAAAKDILTFIIENTQDSAILIEAQSHLVSMKIKMATPTEYLQIENEITVLLERFGSKQTTISLQIILAHFETFYLKNSEKGKALLRAALELPYNQYQQAEIKMELADVLLYEEKYNQALLYYSQIEENLKNDVIGHQASLKAARTSYFKTDFVWAQKQFKELKSASSQLIANDALEYFLLINDNTVADSTQTALKEFAKGDYWLYQNKNQEAIAQFQLILKKFKGQEIESITLLRLGKTYEKTGEYQLALSQYQEIIELHQDGIYVDEALYFAAEIYSKISIDNEKAKAYYEKLVFHHEDSIYFVDARRKYRELRGDKEL